MEGGMGAWREGGMEGGREALREGGREANGGRGHGGREGGDMEGGREAWREGWEHGGREGGMERHGGRFAHTPLFHLFLSLPRPITPVHALRSCLLILARVHVVYK